MRRLRDETGAAAVEFALVAPVLFMLLFGIIEFGNVYNVQIQVTSAAREAARTMAVENNAVAARAAAKAAVPTLVPALADGQITVAPAACAAGQSATVTIRYPVTSITGLFATGITLQGKSVMRCGG